MDDAAFILGSIGLGGAVVCIGAYVWGYIFKVKGFRPLSVLALFATVVAMAQLALLLVGAGGRMNAVYAMAFLIISGLSQAYTAVRSRPARDGVRTREGDRED